MRQQLKNKDDTIAKYRQVLVEQRKSLVAEATLDKGELDKLNEKLAHESEAVLSKLKDALERTPDIAAYQTSAQAVTALEQQLETKDKLAMSLSMQVSMLEQENISLKEQIVDLRVELAEIKDKQESEASRIPYTTLESLVCNVLMIVIIR